MSGRSMHPEKPDSFILIDGVVRCTSITVPVHARFVVRVPGRPAIHHHSSRGASGSNHFQVRGHGV